MKLRKIALLGALTAVIASAVPSPFASSQELPGLWVPSIKDQPLPAQPPTDLAGFEQTTGTVKGTAVHAVLVGDLGTTVAAFTGPVDITFANGHLPVHIEIGTQAVFGAKAELQTKTLAQIVAEEKANGTTSMVTTLMKGVQYMADTVAQTLVFNGEESAKVLATMVNTASTANPTDAHTYVSIAVYGILQNSALANSTEGKAAIAAVVNQAVAAVGSNSPEAGLIFDTAVKNSGGQFTHDGGTTNTGGNNPSTGFPLTPLDPGQINFTSPGASNS